MPSISSSQRPAILAEPGPTSDSAAAWLAVVAEKAKGLRFGVIEIVVHDSRVVQIERTERTRFTVPQTVTGA